jgi:hypothetical protein
MTEPARKSAVDTRVPRQAACATTRPKERCMERWSYRSKETGEILTEDEREDMREDYQANHHGKNRHFDEKEVMVDGEKSVGGAVCEWFEFKNEDDSFSAELVEGKVTSFEQDKFTITWNDGEVVKKDKSGYLAIADFPDNETKSCEYRRCPWKKDPKNTVVIKGFKWFSDRCEGGDMDWVPIAGRVLCKECEQYYEDFGTLDGAQFKNDEERSIPLCSTLLATLLATLLSVNLKPVDASWAAQDKRAATKRPKEFAKNSDGGGSTKKLRPEEFAKNSDGGGSTKKLVKNSSGEGSSKGGSSTGGAKKSVKWNKSGF